MKIDALVLKLLLYMLKLFGKLSGHQSSVSLQQWKSFMPQDFPQGSTNGNYCLCNSFYAVASIEMIATFL